MTRLSLSRWIIVSQIERLPGWGVIRRRVYHYCEHDVLFTLGRVTIPYRHLW